MQYLYIINYIFYKYISKTKLEFNHYLFLFNALQNPFDTQ